MQTPKQERNGVPGPTATHNTAVPGPDSTSVISSAIGPAMAAGDHGASGTPAVSTVGFAVVDWETGIGGHDMPGEA